MKITSVLKRIFAVEEASAEITPDAGDELLNDTPGIETIEVGKAQTPAEPPMARASRIEQIFDTVIAVFNEAQPDFVRQALDTDAQRRYLYDALDESVKKYLNELADETRRRCNDVLHAEQHSLADEMERLRQSADKLQHQREELQQQHVSVERQKRALSDRVRDLEAQVAEFDAEREQLELMNRSLVNKLKVAELQQGPIGDDTVNAVEQLEQLKKEADELNQQHTQLSQQHSELNKQHSELNKKHAELKKQFAELNEQHATMQKQVTELQAQNKQLTEDTNIGVDKVTMAESMVNDMRRRLAEAQSERDKAESELASNREIISNFEKQAAGLLAQMEQVDALITKRDTTIAELKDRVSLLQSELKAANKQVVDLQAAAARQQVSMAEEPSQLMFGDRSRPMISDVDLEDVDRNFNADSSRQRRNGRKQEQPSGHSTQYPDSQMSFSFDE